METWFRVLGDLGIHFADQLLVSYLVGGERRKRAIEGIISGEACGMWLERWDESPLQVLLRPSFNLIITTIQRHVSSSYHLSTMFACLRHTGVVYKIRDLGGAFYQFKFQHLSCFKFWIKLTYGLFEITPDSPRTRENVTLNPWTKGFTSPLMCIL